VLRIDRIYLDEGLEVFDLLRDQKLRVSERSATRQLAVGDLVLGWLCKDPAGTLTLEGGVAHVPGFIAGPILSLVHDLRRAMPPLSEEQAWKRHAADLVPPLIAAIVDVRESPPLPTLQNTSGDPLELVTGHYCIRDYTRVAAVLSREFLENGDGSYSSVDEAGTLLARFQLSTSVLRVQTNSRKRLKTVEQRLEDLLGNAVERSLAVHERRTRGTRAPRANSQSRFEIATAGACARAHRAAPSSGARENPRHAR